MRLVGNALKDFGNLEDDEYAVNVIVVYEERVRLYTIATQIECMYRWVGGMAKQTGKAVSHA